MTDICDRLNDMLKDRETGQWLVSGHCTDATAELVAEARDEIRRLRDVIRITRALVSEGAAEGFNPLAGNDWADRLFKNQWNLSQALPTRQ